ncbi:unnamed protein product [Laminaria digitata]
MGEPSQQEAIWFWNESCVKVANNSDYKVSYWVEQECKMKTRGIQETVLTTMETKLNGKASTDGAEGMLLGAVGAVSVGARATKKAKRETTVTTEQTEMVSYFLMKDHRMTPRRGTPSTTVNFPVGCKHLRVYAFFQAKDGTWKSYKDKVYSVGSRKRKFTLTALNVNIKPYL